MKYVGDLESRVSFLQVRAIHQHACLPRVPVIHTLSSHVSAEPGGWCVEGSQTQGAPRPAAECRPPACAGRRVGHRLTSDTFGGARAGAASGESRVGGAAPISIEQLQAAAPARWACLKRVDDRRH